MRGTIHLGPDIAFTCFTVVPRLPGTHVTIQETSAISFTVIPIPVARILRARPGTRPVSITVPVVVKGSATAPVPIASSSASAPVAKTAAVRLRAERRIRVGGPSGKWAVPGTSPCAVSVDAKRRIPRIPSVAKVSAGWRPGPRRGPSATESVAVPIAPVPLALSAAVLPIRKVSPVAKVQVTVSASVAAVVAPSSAPSTASASEIPGYGATAWATGRVYEGTGAAGGVSGQGITKAALPAGLEGCIVGARLPRGPPRPPVAILRGAVVVAIWRAVARPRATWVAIIS